LISERTKLALAAAETLYSRLLLLGACLGFLRSGERRRARWWAVAALGFGLSPWGYLAELALLGGLLAERPTPGRRPLLALAAALLGLCCVTHVVFFGAARYALIWLPWLALLMVRRNAPQTGPQKHRETSLIPEPLRVF
ncbi:MAG TPA: hypothetical protein VIW29_22265, partial [Polyangiaceae bacterium]